MLGSFYNLRGTVISKISCKTPLSSSNIVFESFDLNFLRLSTRLLAKSGRGKLGLRTWGIIWTTYWQGMKIKLAVLYITHLNNYFLIFDLIVYTLGWMLGVTLLFSILSLRLSAEFVSLKDTLRFLAHWQSAKLELICLTRTICFGALLTPVTALQASPNWIFREFLKVSQI